MAELAIKIDPTDAAAGARTIRREIEWIGDAANDMEKAVEDAAAGAGKAIGRARDEFGRFTKAGNDAAGGARTFKRSTDDLTRAVGEAGKGVTRFTGAANDNFAKLNAQVASVTGTFRSLMVVLGPLAALFSVSALANYADAWSDMQSRVGAAIRDMDAAPAMMKRLVDIANASYSPLSQTVEIYGRNVAVLRDLGRGAVEAADFTEALNHALVTTATKGQDADVVLNALSRSIAIGGLRAMEFETIMSRSPRVLEAIADEMGTTVTGLRKLATEGKVTGQVIVDALIGSLEQLREEAAEMPATIGDAFVRIGTNLMALIGQMDKAAGASEAIAGVLIKLGDNLGRVITYAGTAVTAFGVYYVGAMVAANASTITLAGSLAFLRAAMVRTGILALVVLAGELAFQLMRLVEATGGVAAAFAELGRRSEILFDAVVWAFRAAAEAIKSIWYSAMADLLRATEDALGPILRTFGITAEGVASSIEKLERSAKNWGEIAADSASIAAEQLKKAFAELETADAGDSLDEVRKAAEAVDEKYTKLIDTAQRRLDQMQLEIDLVGKSGIEADALRFRFDLLAKAKEQNIAVGEKERQKIDELTESYRRLSTELARSASRRTAPTAR
jgi:tape measure domain-containing protein